MYEAFYGLQTRPFNLLPDTKFLFFSRQHTEALAHLQYGLTGRPGVTMLIGEAGTGKTTLIRKALEAASAQGRASRIVQLSNPTLTRAEFYEYLAVGFGFSPEAAASKSKFLHELEAAVMASPPDGVMALVFDEAQSVPHDLLEEIRLLTNLHTVDGRGLTIVLIGQPELAARLDEGRLRQLKQRVALRCELAPLSLQDTVAYISRRLEVAGGGAVPVFTRAAVELIHERSGGIPRTISVLCDNALVAGFATNTKPVGRELIVEVCNDFGLAETKSAVQPSASSSPAPRSGAGIFAEPDTSTEPASADTAGADDDVPMFARFARKKRFSIFRGTT